MFAGRALFGRAASPSRAISPKRSDRQSGPFPIRCRLKDQPGTAGAGECGAPDRPGEAVEGGRRKPLSLMGLAASFLAAMFLSLLAASPSFAQAPPGASLAIAEFIDPTPAEHSVNSGDFTVVVRARETTPQFDCGDEVRTNLDVVSCVETETDRQWTYMLTVTGPLATFTAPTLGLSDETVPLSRVFSGLVLPTPDAPIRITASSERITEGEAVTFSVTRDNAKEDLDIVFNVAATNVEITSVTGAALANGRITVHVPGYGDIQSVQSSTVTFAVQTAVNEGSAEDHTLTLDFETSQNPDGSRYGNSNVLGAGDPAAAVTVENEEAAFTIAYDAPQYEVREGDIIPIRVKITGPRRIGGSLTFVWGYNGMQIQGTPKKGPLETDFFYWTR